jgi:sugar lactone lactonase YvrE
LIIAAVFACSFSPTQAQDEAATAARRASLERIQALRRERPGDGLLVYYQALTHVALGERETAFDLLRSLKGRKLGLIPVRDMGWDAVWDDSTFQAICKQLADDEPETPAAPVAFRLKDRKLIPEGIAYDAKSMRFFLGSSLGKIIATDAQGDARDFSSPDDKLDFVLGLAVDAERGHLYAVSTNGFLDAAKRERRNEIVRYDLKKGRLLDRFPAADAMQLNDLAVAADGTLYVTDSMDGSLFRKKPDEKALTRLGTKGGLRGVNGVALSKDGALYVAISTGIARVDLATGTPTRLPQPDNVATGGIDGLYWHEGALFAVQNVTNPGRVVRIDLAEEGNRIAGVTVLQSHHHPDFAQPTTGAIANDALYVIANSHVGHHQPDGTIKNPEALKEPTVIAVPLQR